jgi:aarF domain-containing kinase
MSRQVLRRRSYRTTLNQRDTLEDADEREHVLKACHKRCADRTLKVLEKNGGIFIKLGQHLVGFPADHDKTPC